jgi:16S rRNA processing protein RimM
LLTIGRVTGLFGSGGEVRIVPMTDSLERFRDIEYLLVDGNTRLTIQSVRIHRRQVVIRFSGFEDRDSAESLRGKLLYVDREHAAPLAEGAHYYADLCGCTVLTSAGETLGTLFDIQNAGSSDVYYVRGERGEILIPAVSDIVSEIDIERRRIVIEPVEGLLS